MYVEEPILPEDSELWRRLCNDNPSLEEFSSQSILTGWAFKFSKRLMGDSWEKRYFLFLPKFICYFSSTDRSARMSGCFYLPGATTSNVSKDSLPSAPSHNPAVSNPMPVLVINTITPRRPSGNYKELVILLFTPAMREQWERHVNAVSKLLMMDQMTIQARKAGGNSGGGGRSPQGGTNPTATSPKASTSPKTIGEPCNVKQSLHVEIDPTAEFGLRGLPPHFEMILRKSGLTKEDIRTHAKEVVQVLDFQDKMLLDDDLPPAPLVDKTKSLNDIIDTRTPSDLYKDFQKLDAGSQGEVFKARRIADGKEVAVKKITIKNERKDLPNLEREILTMHAANHENIVRLYSCHRTGMTVWIAMELMHGGKLTEMVDAKKGNFTDPQVAYIMKNILLGLQYLHEHQQMHRDIKSDNVLVDNLGNLKLGDFGFTAMCGEEDKRKTVVGTPYWMAPEVIRGEVYNYKADIWSVGILGLELVDGEPPLMDMSPMKALYVIVTQPAPRVKSTKHSKLCCEFMAAMLVKDPMQRPDCTVLLQHPFLATACRDGMFLIKKPVFEV
eukprot:PhF_6_TR15672/c0_g1_i1/m.24367/K04409/PAK1; p21-activated kinase 1